MIKKILLIGGISLIFLTGLRMLSDLIINEKFTQKKSNILSQTIKVGHLPVTCHLTCPVLDYTTKTTDTPIKFKSTRFSDFPTIANAIQSKDLLATFMVAPLALKLREDGVPVKICYLGHRDGSQLVVKKNSSYKTLKDLKGKKIAIPSLYSNQHFVIVELIEQMGMSKDDIEFIVLPPPEMLTSLAAGSIDGYFVGEPFPAKAELENVGRILYLSSEIWPQFISCVLVVHEDLINENPDAVHELVRGIAESGAWAEINREDAAKIASKYFRQEPKLLEHILTSKKQRVSYVRLKPETAEIDKIAEIGTRMGLLNGSVKAEDILDTRFIPEHIVPAKIKVEN